MRYVIGEIIKSASKMLIRKQFDKKLFVIEIEIITYIIAVNVASNLWRNLFFFFLIGLFFVSAGLFLKMRIVAITPKIYFARNGIVTYIAIIGIPRNATEDVIRQTQLFVACIPYALFLRMANIIRKHAHSLWIFSKNKIIRCSFTMSQNFVNVYVDIIPRVIIKSTKT